MDLKKLLECKFVSDVREVGPTVEFKTVLYSISSMQMETVVISVPISGNFILTDVAKIVSGEIYGTNEDHKELLEQLFVSLEQSDELDDHFDSQIANIETTDSKLQNLAIEFLKEQGGKTQDNGIENLRFLFLKKCSENFQKAHERYTK